MQIWREPMNIIYREAKPTDAELMLLHMKTVGDETDNLTYDGSTFNISPEKEARFISRFVSSDKDNMILAIDSENDLVVGVGIVEHSRIARLSHTAEISITVMRDYWSRGIGTTLMNIMVSFAKNADLHLLTLFVRSDNSAAISLYKKTGFTKTGKYPDYFSIRGKFYDADLMHLLL